MEILKEGLSCYGFYTWKTIRNGKVVDEGRTPNMVVNVGLAEIGALIGYGLSGTAFRYLAAGTGDTAVAATDTALGAEITDSGLARAEAAITQTTTTTTNDTTQFYKEFTITGSKAVAEVGVFNASSAGDMLSRSVLTSVKNLESGDIWQLTYKIVFARP